MFHSLINHNLTTEINAPREHVGLGWRQGEDGTWIVARITDEGLRAIGIDPNEDSAAAETAPTGAEGPAPQGEDAPTAQAAPLTEEIALLAGKPGRTPREPSTRRKPREGTKQEQVPAMLRRPEGATV